MDQRAELHDAILLGARLHGYDVDRNSRSDERSSG